MSAATVTATHDASATSPTTSGCAKCFVFLLVALGGYFLPQWLWGWTIPFHQIVYGVIIGSLTALTSFGLALVYRANKVINFAQADLGAVPASLAVGARDGVDVVVLDRSAARARLRPWRSARSSSSRSSAGSARRRA